MNLESTQSKGILARTKAENFIGREVEADQIRRHFSGETASAGLLLLSAPVNGASELLRQIYDRAFFGQDETIPFYFAVNRTDQTAVNCARRFLQTFLLQTIAFRLQNDKLLAASPQIREIIGLASDADRRWLEPLAALYERENIVDERTFIENCLSAPLRAETHGAQSFVIIDDLHNAEDLTGSTKFIEELKSVYSRSTVKFIFAGYRRHVLKAAQSGSATLRNPEVIRLESFSRDAAASFVEMLAGQHSVKINDQSQDLLIQQLNTNPFFIESIFIAAGKGEKELDSFQGVQQAYIDELFGGAIGQFYDTQFAEIAPNSKVRTNIIRLLHNLAEKEFKKSKADSWRRHLEIGDEDFNRILRELHTREIINLNSNTIEPTADNLCLKDYIEIRYRLEVLNEQRAFVVGDFLAKSLQRASHIMMQSYRRSSAIGLRGMLKVFDSQEVPAALLDYEIFKNDYKGSPKEEVTRKLAADKDLILLPHVVFTAQCSAFYPPIKQVADEDRSAVALGFRSADYRKENEIVWIVAEIDSKLEAAPELTEFWCDRLEMVALACSFANYQLWLITPEGFSPESSEILKQRKAFGSSREQIRLLVERLNAENIVPEKSGVSEYEMILPMGDDTEMIAARAVEEIARRHDFKPKAITQIKTALVEACINATEHSLSPDRKIHQKFTFEDNKIVITISNRGVKIPSEKVAQMTTQIEPSEGRRGWGLKLMRTLMDEVKFEQVDDGTKISMIKYLV